MTSYSYDLPQTIILTGGTSGLGYAGARFAMPNMQSLDASGQALARLVLDPDLEGISGKYFAGMNERASSQESYDQHKAAELWEASAELVQLQPSETILQVHSTLKER